MGLLPGVVNLHNVTAGMGTVLAIHVNRKGRDITHPIRRPKAVLV
jgi:hypothetical protein